MKNLPIILIALFVTLSSNAQNVTVIIWSDNFECIVNQNINSNSINDVVDQIADTLSPTFFLTTRSETGDKLIKMPMTRYFIVYNGTAMSEEELHRNTGYLKTYRDHHFYLENPEWYSRIQINDSVILQVSNQAAGPFQTKTELSDGTWYQFIVNDNKGNLLQEVNIVDNKINGYLKEYAGSSTSKVSKFKNGILVDTSLFFNNNYLSGYEIRDSLGLKLMEWASFYPNSQNFANFTDYTIGYSFTFFEDGTISSMVKVKNYIETGILLEFDHNGNVIGKKKTFER